MGHVIGAAALALLMLGGWREARATPVIADAQLDYAAAPGCPDAAGFEAIVTGRLGHDAFAASAPDRVIVRIESTGRALEGRLEWRDAAGGSMGKQVFPSRSGDCDELTRAIGFALALQIQLMAATAAEARAGRAPPREARAPVPAAPPPAIQVESAGPAPSGLAGRPSVLVGAGAAGAIGVSSEPVAVGRLFGRAEWSHVAIELAGEASLPSTTHRADGAGFSQEELLASLAGCGVRAPLSLCAVGKVGELRVAGRGVDVPLTASGLTVQAGLRLAASHPVGRRTILAAHIEALGRLTRGTVTLDSMPVWTTPGFIALLGIDVAFRFR